ncbi:MAG TPA: hypothetical protein VFR86_29870 [Burkholderiaceae bacterium]|nr:hypothetical protein [Burkholderiaceae bacterium]
MRPKEGPAADDERPIEKRGFIAPRWHGQVPLGILFWRDMIAVGTLINLMSGLAALMLLALGASSALAVAVHFAPVPYNAFLLSAVWRAPGRTASHAIAAAIWFCAMVIV